MSELTFLRETKLWQSILAAVGASKARVRRRDTQSTRGEGNGNTENATREASPIPSAPTVSGPASAVGFPVDTVLRSGGGA